MICRSIVSPALGVLVARRQSSMTARARAALSSRCLALRVGLGGEDFTVDVSGAFNTFIFSRSRSILEWSVRTELKWCVSTGPCWCSPLNRTNESTGGVPFPPRLFTHRVRVGFGQASGGL